MAISSSDISALYITLFNRAPEGAGHEFWLKSAYKQSLNLSQVAAQMLDTDASKEYFAGKETNFDFINHIYANLFGKTNIQDPDGVKFWTDSMEKGASKAFIVSEILNAATNNAYTKAEDIKAQKLFLNKVNAAEITHRSIKDVPSKGTINEKISGFSAILKNIKEACPPVHIAQVVKQEALKANLQILSDDEVAKITKEVFASVNLEEAKKALKETTATSDICPSKPTPKPSPGGDVRPSEEYIKLNQVGDTSVYKSDDGKYIVNLGADAVMPGKALAVGKNSNKIYEISESSNTSPVLKFNDKPLLKQDMQGGTIYKNGAITVKFISKDGKVVFAYDGENSGFVLKEDVSDGYETMSQAKIQNGEFKINADVKAAYKTEIVKISPQSYQISKIKAFDGVSDYKFGTVKPAVDRDLKISQKDMTSLKIPPINGKIYSGEIDGFAVTAKANGELESIEKDGALYTFDTQEKVKFVKFADYTFILKTSLYLSDAMAKMTDATGNLLAKASSEILNESGDKFILDASGDGNVEKVQVKGGAELTPATATPFGFATINDMRIARAKFSDENLDFTLTATPAPRYIDAKSYQIAQSKEMGRVMLKSQTGYVNSKVEKGGYKFEVFGGDENKYNIVKKDENDNDLSAEQFNDGLYKFVEYNGLAVSSIRLVGSESDDTAVVRAGHIIGIGSANEVGINSLNGGIISFESIEKFEFNVDPTDFVYLDKFNSINKDGTKEIKLNADLTIKSEDGGVIDLAKVEFGGNKLSVNLKVGGAQDTIKFGGKIGNLAINGFETQDKVDFGALGVTDKNVIPVTSGAGATVENGKIYTTDAGGAISGKDYAGGEFDELFAASGTAFKTAATAAGKSIIAVKGTDVTKIYQVDNAEGEGAGTIDASELHLVGVLDNGAANGDKGVMLSDANIA